MTEALSWLLTAEVIGITAYPFAYAAFPTFADRGWGFAKPLGLIVAGFIVWLASSVNLLPSSPWAWWLAVGLVGSVSWLCMWPRRKSFGEFMLANKRAILAGEALFLFFFIAWTLYRAYDPAIAGTEKPMDFMLMNSSYLASHAPPEDAWLSGQPVAYYYFGYWLFAGVAKLAATPTYIGFNLALSLIAAMSAGALFSLVVTLVRNDGGSLRAALLAGTAGTVLLLVISNLAGWWELLANFDIGGDHLYDWLAINELDPNSSPGNWRPDTHWWWWRSSRVINTFGADGTGLDFTIQEFPFFSLLLGDMHPHLMSVPFVLTGLAAAFNVLRSPGRWGLEWITSNWSASLALVLLAGSAGFINAWDIAFLAAALAGVVTLKVRRETGRHLGASVGRGLPPLLLLLGIGVALFAPFYFGTFQSQVRWPPVGPAEFGTRPIHFLTVWGLLMLVAAPVLIGTAASALRPYIDHVRLAVRGVQPRPRLSLHPFWIAIAAVVVPYVAWGIAHLEFNDLAKPEDTFTRLLNTLPLAVTVIGLFTAVAARAKAGHNDAAQFVLTIALVAVYLLYGAELFFVHDLFGNRMNTVFKFYYQTWIILSVVGAYGLWWWWQAHPEFKGWRLAASRTAAIFVCVLLVGSLYYPVAAAASKTGGYWTSPTLDGLAHLAGSAGAERRGIEFLSGDARSGERIVEAPGGSYTEFARVSGSTGLATVMGWTGHERQWRGSLDLYQDREPDIERLYVTPEAGEAQEIINRYGIDYVVAGPRERQEYPAIELQKFDQLGIRVFEEEGFVIYRVTGTTVSD